MEKKEIIANEVKNGAVLVENLVVADVAVSADADITKKYVTIKFTASDVEHATADGTGYVKVDYVVMSVLSLIGGLGDDVKPSIKRHIKQCPTVLEDLLFKAKMSVLQMKIDAGKPYTNPFASEPKPVDPTSVNKVYSHIASVDFGSDGKSLLKQISMMRNFGAAMFAAM